MTLEEIRREPEWKLTTTGLEKFNSGFTVLTLQLLRMAGYIHVGQYTRTYLFSLASFNTLLIMRLIIMIVANVYRDPIMCQALML